MLRAGYVSLGLAFAALAGSISVPTLVVPGLALAFLGGLLLALSGDDLPKWAGITLMSYFVLTALLFIAATPITINRGGEGYFVNRAPPALADEIFYWVGLVSPLILGGAAVAAVWERERPPRLLLMGAVGGFVLVALLSVVLIPRDVGGGADTQGRLLQILFALSAASGAAGALWAAGRADETA